MGSEYTKESLSKFIIVHTEQEYIQLQNILYGHTLNFHS